MRKEKQRAWRECVQLGGCAGDVPAEAWCVRAVRPRERACAVRAAELVRVRSIGEYLSAAVGYEMRYVPHGTSNDRARTRAPRRTLAVRPIGTLKATPPSYVLAIPTSYVCAAFARC